MKAFRLVLMFSAGAIVCLPLTGCLVVTYSSGGGWWVWPGSVVGTLLLVLVWFLARR